MDPFRGPQRIRILRDLNLDELRPPGGTPLGYRTPPAYQAGEEIEYDAADPRLQVIADRPTSHAERALTERLPRG